MKGESEYYPWRFILHCLYGFTGSATDKFYDTSSARVDELSARNVQYKSVKKNENSAYKQYLLNIKKTYI